MVTTGPMVMTMMTSVMTSMMTSMMASMMTIATAARTATDEEQHRGRESRVQQAQVKFDISYSLPVPHQHSLSPLPSEMSLNNCLEIGAKRCTFGSESKGFCHYFIFETIHHNHISDSYLSPGQLFPSSAGLRATSGRGCPRRQPMKDSQDLRPVFLRS